MKGVGVTDASSDSVLSAAPEPDARTLAGRFGGLVGMLSDEEAAELETTLDAAFENISDEW